MYRRPDAHRAGKRSLKHLNRRANGHALELRQGLAGGKVVDNHATNHFAAWLPGWLRPARGVPDDQVGDGPHDPGDKTRPVDPFRRLQSQPLHMTK